MRADGAHWGLELYHSAVIVDDIHAAIALYERAADLQFTEVKDLAMTVTVDGKPRATQFLAVYSKSGPPYLELIQDQSGGVWGRHGLDLRHLGFFTTDVKAAAELFEANGCVTRVLLPGSPPRIEFVEAPGGTWIELVGPEARASFEQWQQTSYERPDG
jgi:Glyoxalase/Bleomycin resistance protein/Dioxygenase superfamily